MAAKVRTSSVSNTKTSAEDSERYRRLALALPDTLECAHMGAPDFRVELGGKRRIFATLAYASQGFGTLMLDVEAQRGFLADAPEYFSAVAGGWGKMGATLVRLDAPESLVAGGLSAAHRHMLAKMSAKKVARKAKSSL